MRYKAFISYRHLPPGRKWAKWLHKVIDAKSAISLANGGIILAL
jgi:hypothetical protein